MPDRLMQPPSNQAFQTETSLLRLTAKVHSSGRVYCFGQRLHVDTTGTVAERVNPPETLPCVKRVEHVLRKPTLPFTSHPDGCSIRRMDKL